MNSPPPSANGSRSLAMRPARRDPERHLARLAAVSERIDALVKSLPSPVEPQLVHYLSRCSYDKALEFLEARKTA
jgi:hypothetical protein